ADGEGSATSSCPGRADPHRSTTATASPTATPSASNPRSSTHILDALPMPASTATPKHAAPTATEPTFRGRRERAAAVARDGDLAALLVGPGSDLAYLCGYRMHTSDRMTCLVIAADGASTLVVPELEAPRATRAAPDLDLRTWGETADPTALVAGLIDARGPIAVDDRMWASFVLRLQAALAGRPFVPASRVTTRLRVIKDATEGAKL